MRRGIKLGIGLALVVAIGVLAFLLVGAKSDLSDTKDRLSTAQGQHGSDTNIHASDQATIKKLKATVLKLNPPAWSKQVAAQMYLKIVKAGNDRLDQFQKIKNPSLKQAKKFASDMAVLMNRQAQAFQAGKWPKFARSAINDVIDARADDVDKYTREASATTIDEYNSVVFKDNKAAQKARIVLGLPRAK